MVFNMLWIKIVSTIILVGGLFVSHRIYKTRYDTIAKDIAKECIKMEWDDKDPVDEMVYHGMSEIIDEIEDSDNSTPIKM